MVTKLGRVTTYGRKTQPAKSHEHLMTWSGDKRKRLISPVPQYLWPPNLAEW